MPVLGKSLALGRTGFLSFPQVLSQIAARYPRDQAGVISLTHLCYVTELWIMFPVVVLIGEANV
jgi:hypothetical protein